MDLPLYLLKTPGLVDHAVPKTLEKVGEKISKSYFLKTPGYFDLRVQALKQLSTKVNQSK